MSTELKRARQIADELVRPGKADLRVVDAKRSHPLQQANRAGYGDVEVWLLQPIPKTSIEQLDFSGSGVLHLS